MESLKEIAGGIVALMLAFFGVTATPAPDVPLRAHELAQVLEVVDGDTLIVSLNGNNEFVRYIGVDTPEAARNGEDAECYAAEAARYNEQLVGNREIELRRGVADRDAYHRLLRHVYVAGASVEALLLQGGYATVLTVPPNTEHAEVYRQLEREAAEAGTGLWSACKG